MTKWFFADVSTRYEKDAGTPVPGLSFAAAPSTAPGGIGYTNGPGKYTYIKMRTYTYCRWRINFRLLIPKENIFCKLSVAFLTGFLASGSCPQLTSAEHEKAPHNPGYHHDQIADVARVVFTHLKSRRRDDTDRLHAGRRQSAPPAFCSRAIRVRFYVSGTTDKRENHWAGALDAAQNLRPGWGRPRVKEES